LGAPGSASSVFSVDSNAFTWRKRARQPEGGDSSLRQVRRLTNVLIKVRKGALTQKNVKNEDWFSEFIENKGAKRVVLRVY
jgi:hypothetical protein